jgi:hypothetical protein
VSINEDNSQRERFPCFPMSWYPNMAAADTRPISVVSSPPPMLRDDGMAGGGENLGQALRRQQRHQIPCILKLCQPVNSRNNPLCLCLCKGPEQ